MHSLSPWPRWRHWGSRSANGLHSPRHHAPQRHHDGQRMKETVMHPSPQRWPWTASLLALALLGSVILAGAVTLDREGVPVPPTLCPSVDVVKAAATAQKG